jgi:hypothetical protein
MAIKTKCPSCDAQYKLAYKMRGKNVRCKACGNAFVVEAMENKGQISEAEKAQDPSGDQVNELANMFVEAMISEAELAAQIDTSNIRTTHELTKVTMSVLNVFVDMHDEIFAASLGKSMRRIIPIPGVFDPVDHKEHAEGLNCQSTVLEGAIAQVPRLKKENLGHQNFLDFYLTYGTALLDSIKRLHAICSLLYEKSQGEGAYSHKEYERDVKAYEKSMKHYGKLGNKLQKLLPTTY